MNLLTCQKPQKHLNTWDDVFDAFFLDRPLVRGASYMPEINIVSDEYKIAIKAEIPGIKKEEISIEYHDGLLTISGEKKPLQKQENAHFVREEIRYGSFSRSIKVGHVNFGSSEATYENGVLSIILPKAEDAKSSKLLIK